ncbi:MAG: 30S ribosomal protein S1 [Gammaproteobacteria bacterium]|nr:30S ribosomal protein S1 [Gammaproteobacteria bacterium]
MSENFADLFAESMSNQQLSPGTLITAKIVRITNDHIVVNAGLKSEGVIPLVQFLNAQGELTVQPGDEVEVVIEKLEDGFGETILSRDKAKRAETWRRLIKAHEDNAIIQGIIVAKVKGGFTVDLDDIKAFLPGSLIDVRPLRDTTHLEGHLIDLKLIKIDQKRNNVVVSRRAVIEAESGAERQSLLENMQEGSEIKGVVKNLTDYGAFVDLGGVDGLLHITDMSWKRIKHPSEMLNVGDEIDVKILKYDREKNRVSLGMKQLGSDPWSDLARRYQVGSRLFGKVTTITDYGCFVEIDNGVEGLVHMSEMDWTNKNINPNKIVNVGQDVEVMVLEIDEERRRFSLGLKQCIPNPWDEFSAIHKMGEVLKGQIKSITDFGIFVGLAGGIDGLVHLSDLSWDKTGEEAVKDFKKGQEVEAVVLAIDSERERISLGIKQLTPNHFAAYAEQHPKGSIVTGIVTVIGDKEVSVDLGHEIEGSIKISDLSQEKVTDPHEFIRAGEEISAKVMGVDKKTRIVSLSIKAKEQQDQKTVLQELKQSSVPNATFGDLLKGKMNNE